MQTRWNVTAQFLLPQGHEPPSVPPGAPHDFTDEEAASLGPEWSDQPGHPWLSLAAGRVHLPAVVNGPPAKKKAKATPQGTAPSTDAPATTEPAEPGKPEGEQPV